MKKMIPLYVPVVVTLAFVGGLLTLSGCDNNKYQWSVCDYKDSQNKFAETCNKSQK